MSLTELANKYRSDKGTTSPDYKTYFTALCGGEPFVVVDVCGTGWSINHGR
jgi:hypothetical protein